MFIAFIDRVTEITGVFEDSILGIDDGSRVVFDTTVCLLGLTVRALTVDEWLVVDNNGRIDCFALRYVDEVVRRGLTVNKVLNFDSLALFLCHNYIVYVILPFAETPFQLFPAIKEDKEVFH